MLAAEARAAIQRATEETETVLASSPWPCTDLRPVAGQQLSCIDRGPGDPVHWRPDSPCVGCRLTMCLDVALRKLQGAANWARGLA